MNTAMRSPTKPDSKSHPMLSQFRVSSILVVDENKATRNGLRDVLYGMGFGAVHLAADARQAMLEIAAHEPTLILVDYRLPKMDGLMFTERLRRDTSVGNNAMPVILMATDVDAALVVAARDAGVNEVVVKPISMQVLVRRLMHALIGQRMMVKGGGYVGPDRRRRGERRLGDRRHTSHDLPGDIDRRNASSRRQGDRRRPAVAEEMLEPEEA